MPSHTEAERNKNKKKKVMAFNFLPLKKVTKKSSRGRR